MAASEHIENTIRAVMRLLEQEVLVSVEMQTHTDFGQIAQPPVLILYFPRIRETRTEASNEWVNQKDLESMTYRASPPPRFYDLEFDYEIVARTTSGPEGLAQLSQRCLAFFAEHPVVEVELTDDAGQTCGTDTYQVMPTIELTPGPVGQDYRTARGAFVVQEVRVEDRRTVTGPLVGGFELTYEDEEKDIREVRKHL